MPSGTSRLMTLFMYLSIFHLILGGSSSFATDSIYKGMCDASAAVPVGPDHFLVANDETDVLNLYAIGTPDVVKSFDQTDALQEDGREADIEGATHVGHTSVTYWITSHGRNRKGKLRPDRYRLFGLRLEGASVDDFKPHMIGKPFKNLVSDLLDKTSWEEPQDTVISRFKAVTQLDESQVRDLAPKKEGLNIEGLAAKPNDNTLLIGLRNPLIEGKAVLIHLLNPNKVLTHGSRARFSKAILLDLGGLGIRSIEYSRLHGVYFIVAGPAGSNGPFSLSIWSGNPLHDPVILYHVDQLEGSNPEALIFNRKRGVIYLLSDEGSRPVETIECKKLPPSQQSFSSREINPTILSEH